jgi:hypothetical protein
MQQSQQQMKRDAFSNAVAAGQLLTVLCIPLPAVPSFKWITKNPVRQSWQALPFSYFHVAQGNPGQTVREASGSHPQP